MSRWVKQAQAVKLEQMHDVWSKLEAAVVERSEINDSVKVRGLAASKLLVGCTTSGAAKYRRAPHVNYNPQ